jgi:hypothetical protein
MIVQGMHALKMHSQENTRMRGDVILTIFGAKKKMLHAKRGHASRVRVVMLLHCFQSCMDGRDNFQMAYARDGTSKPVGFSSFYHNYRDHSSDDFHPHTTSNRPALIHHAKSAIADYAVHQNLD